MRFYLEKVESDEQMIRFEEMNAEERLKEYIERDEIYQEYKQYKLMNPSDFEIFCIQHCKDVEEILEENQKLKQKYETAVADYETTMAEKNELKKHLEVPETCNLKTLEDYKSYYKDTTREQILANTYIEYCAYVNLAHRYSELKKQLENYKKLGFKHLQDKNNNLETQQKEFINYLQEELNVQIQEESIGCEITNKRYILEEILLKYKKIIGNDINVGSKGVKDE